MSDYDPDGRGGTLRNMGQSDESTGLDTSSNAAFFEYYARESQSGDTVRRFETVRNKILGFIRPLQAGEVLDVADVGCGAGTQTMLWAESGHRARGLDINAPLIELARRRAREKSLDIQFEVGSATALPWADVSLDVCLVPELLEHVADWKRCLDEFARVLRPGGVLYLSTTNKLCPRQQEFDLPIYSWYPSWLKRRYEQLAVTTRPELVNHAKYPAVNWFTFYGLQRDLAARGLRSLDRFDAIDTRELRAIEAVALAAARRLPPLRLLGHMLTSYTIIFALKPC